MADSSAEAPPTETATDRESLAITGVAPSEPSDAAVTMPDEAPDEAPPAAPPDVAADDAAMAEAPPTEQTPAEQTPAEQTPDPTCSFFSYDEGFIGGNATDLIFDPTQLGRAYAVSGGQLYRSDDSAASFSPLPIYEAHSLATSPNGAALYFSGKGGLRSMDVERETERVLSLGGLSIHSLLVHPAQGAHIYIGLNRSTLLHSSDGGSNFEVANHGLPQLDPTGLLGDPLQAGRVVMSAAYLTEQGGWAVEGGIWTTDDFGDHWQSVYESGGRVHGMAQCDGDPQVIWGIPVLGGPVRSTDGARTFEVVEGDLGLSTATRWEGRFPTSIAVGGDNCEVIYLGIRNEGIYRSTDGGNTYELLSADGMTRSASSLRRLRVDPYDPQTVVAIMAGGTFYSTDSGDHFAALDLGFPAIKTLVVSPQNPWELVAATWGTGVFRRFGPNSNWEAFSSEQLPDDYANTAVALPLTGGYLVGGWPGTYTSTDGGETFLAGEACNLIDATVDTHNSDRVYAASLYCGVLLSEDGGQTFAESNDGLRESETTQGPLMGTVQILTDPVIPGRTYVGRMNDGIYLRAADTQPWQASLNTMNQRVLCLVDDGQRVFACVEGVGIVRSDDSGQTWQYDHEGIDNLNVADMAYDPTSDRMFVATSSGVYVREGASGPYSLLDGQCSGLGVSSLAVIGDGQERLLVMARSSELLASEL